MSKSHAKLTLEIRTVKHLTYRLGISEEELRSVAEQVDTLYQSWEEPKKNGKMRQITAPKKRLKDIQKAIKRLLMEIDISDCAHGGIKNHSPITNALHHTGKKWLFWLDFKDFFPNISHHQIYTMFRHDLNCSPDVSSLLTKLCTYNGQLPQGTPTSPYLTNIICRCLDKRLKGLANKFQIKYTRYCDDLCFSGNTIPLIFQEKIKQIILQHHFILNPDKEDTKGRHEPQIVTGLSTNQKRIRIPRKVRRDWRKEAHIFNKYEKDSLPAAISEKRDRSIKGKKAYLEYVRKIGEQNRPNN